MRNMLKQFGQFNLGEDLAECGHNLLVHFYYSEIWPFFLFDQIILFDPELDLFYSRATV